MMINCSVMQFFIVVFCSVMQNIFGSVQTVEMGV